MEVTHLVKLRPYTPKSTDSAKNEAIHTIKLQVQQNFK